MRGRDKRSGRDRQAVQGWIRRRSSVCTPIAFIGPEDGMLACGYEGLGRLWKVEDIAFRAEFLLARQENLIA